jgi:fructoselysine-6-P-deglycase FrlB-like protein
MPSVLSTVEEEVSKQPAALEAFLREDLAEAPPGSIFVGAGDSFAASRIAGSLSSGMHAALDPYELVSDPTLAKGRNVYFVSSSGRTASNIAGAKAVMGIARERTAVTADVNGRLCAATDSAIFIPYKVVPRLPGTLSFSLSLLALLKLTKGSFDCDFERMHAKAERDAGRVLFSGNDVTHFLGNGAAFPICLYAALKVYEILGGRARYDLLEEFSHAPLFALRKRDCINVFGAFDPLGLGEKLCGSLRSQGFRASAIPSFGADSFERVFYLVFLSQSSVLKRARSRRLSRPHFVLDPDRLSISDSLIY